MLHKTKRKEPLTADDMLGGFMADLLSVYRDQRRLSVIEFAEQILFNGDLQLFIGQKIVLKAYYNDPFTPEELDLINSWALESENRTSWVKGRRYSNLVIEAGRRASKSVLAAILVLYEFYSLIILDNPAKHYGLIPSDPIGIFVIARSMDQVKDTLFAKITGYARESFFFQALEQAGEIEILTETIRHRAKNVAIYAKHTNSASLVGYSLKMLVLDEASRFENNEMGENKADEIWGNVGRAVSTFGSEGRKVMISSAWSKNDPIERYYRVSKKDPFTLGFRLTTWHLNLSRNVARDSPVVVSDYNTDEVRARLEYEGIRVGNSGSFIRADLVEEACRGISAVDSASIDINLRREGEVRRFVGNKITRLESCLTPSFAHVDYGEKRDAAALAIARSGLIEDGRHAVFVDVLMQWVPRLDAEGPRTVSFLNVEEIIDRLLKERSVHLLTFDQWQSSASVQRFYAQGIKTQVMGSSRNQQITYYSLLNRLLADRLLIFPRDSLWTPDLKASLTGLVMLPNGKLVHPNAPKDIADAVALAVWNCYQWQLQNHLVEKTKALKPLSLNQNRPKTLDSQALNKLNQLKYHKVI
jgi:hypothetical protein